MKKDVIPFIAQAIIMLSIQSCNKCGNTYTPVNHQIYNCFFKVGSYFIYQDSVDQIIDSEYVCYYNFSPKTLQPELTRDGCQFYQDYLMMSQISFLNGVLYDTLGSSVESPSGLVVFNQKWLNGKGISGIGIGNSPELNLGDFINNYSVAGTTYPVVYRGTPQGILVEGMDTVPIDIYFAPDYGIVQRIEHCPTGNVSWNLIRYYVAQ